MRYTKKDENFLNKQKGEHEKYERKLKNLQKEINYSKLSEKVKSAIEPIDYTLEIETKLTWDGRQFVVRIPKEIVDGYNITKANRMLFKFIKPSPLKSEKQEKPRLEISVV